MNVVLQPGPVASATRVEYWRHTLSEGIYPLDMRAERELCVPDRVRLVSFGPIQVAEVSASGRTAAERTLAHIRASDPDLCKVDTFVGGQATLEQAGRQARLTPGDLALVDGARPARWATEASRGLAIFFPRPTRSPH